MANPENDANLPKDVSGTGTAGAPADSTLTIAALAAGSPAIALAPAAIDLVLLSDLALAAYHLDSHEVLSANGVVANLPEPSQATIAFASVTSALHLLTASDLNLPLTTTSDPLFPVAGVTDTGIYLDSNAAAIAGVVGNSLYLSFRGTNDFGANGPDIAAILAGGGSFDEDEWFNNHLVSGDVGLADYYASLLPLVTALDSYVVQHGISHVYVTGHSLGAAMVDRYMDDHADQASVSYEAVTFADPGYYFFDADPAGRITNFTVDSDLINIADLLLATPGDDNTLVDGVNAPSYEHSMVFYEQIVDFLYAEGVPESLIVDDLDASTPNIDTFVFQATQIPSGPFSGGFTIGQGNDTLYGGYYLTDIGTYAVLGGDGADSLYAYHGTNFLYGGRGSDLLISAGSSDTLYGGDGYDNLYGGAGNDTLYGGANEDIVVGDAGNDSLYGGDGGDVLSELFDPVNSGDDILDGGNGIDIMYSAAGNDTVYGGTDSANNYANLGDGTDTYTGSAGTDVVQGGNGNDTITGNAGDDSLYGEAGDDTIYGGDGIDLLSGSTGNDILDGGNGNDLLVGDDGSDTLRGGGGVDVLYGFAGDDILNGGTGGDVDALYGGLGNDSFQVGGSGYGIDYIYDFTGGVGASDRILIATGATYTTSVASGNYYFTFSNGSQAVVVGRTSMLPEDVVPNGGFV